MNEGANDAFPNRVSRLSVPVHRTAPGQAAHPPPGPSRGSGGPTGSARELPALLGLPPEGPRSALRPGSRAAPYRGGSAPRLARSLPRDRGTGGLLSAGGACHFPRTRLVFVVWGFCFVLGFVRYFFFKGGTERRERVSSRPGRPGRVCRGDWGRPGTRAALLHPQPQTPPWLPPRQVLRPTEENSGRG